MDKAIFFLSDMGRRITMSTSGARATNLFFNESPLHYRDLVLYAPLRLPVIYFILTTAASLVNARWDNIV